MILYAMPPRRAEHNPSVVTDEEELSLGPESVCDEEEPAYTHNKSDGSLSDDENDTDRTGSRSPSPVATGNAASQTVSAQISAPEAASQQPPPAPSHLRSMQGQTRGTYEKATGALVATAAVPAKATPNALAAPPPTSTSVLPINDQVEGTAQTWASLHKVGGDSFGPGAIHCKSRRRWVWLPPQEHRRVCACIH
jgi:hypothetical protein